ncbi:MAG: hypothetical protein WBA51_12775 [Erythrobacter sp.]
MPLGGILRSVINPMNLVQLAMGPAGWASFAMRTIGAQIGMNIIQQLGDRLGIPQPMIDMSQAAFAQSAGMPGLVRENIQQTVDGLGDMFNLSPRQNAELSRAANEDINRAVNDLAASNLEEDEEGGEGGGWLMAIAKALGGKLDQQAAKLEGMADQISDDKPSANLKFSAESQKFSMAFNSANTVIKTIGEALSAGARKQ